MSQIPQTFRDLLTGRPADPVGGSTGEAWLARLPGLLDDQLAAWDLEVDGTPQHGECALVVPVRQSGEPAVLKVTWPHAEAANEHLALMRWGGKGAVRLRAAAPREWALLLERLDAERDLRGVSILEACQVIGGLIRELDIPAGPQFTRITERAEHWAAELAAGSPLLPRRLTDQALAMLQEITADPVPERLVHEDLHDANVLAPLASSHPARGQWLAIDPKPVAAEWAYAVAPIVWNRVDAAQAAYNLRVHVRLRADVVAEAAGLDPERVRYWTFIRLVLNALEATRYDGAVDFRTRMIALAKAFAVA